MTLAALVVGPLFLLVGLVSLVFAIVVVVDMARRPGWQWAQAGSNKTLWLVIEIVCVLLFGFISIIVGVLYFTIARPKLLAVERQGGQGWPQSPGAGWPGSQPPSVPPPSGPPPSWTTGAYPPPNTAPPSYPASDPPSSPAGGPSSYPGSDLPSSPGSGLSPSPGSGPPPYPESGPPPYPESGPPLYPEGGPPPYPEGGPPPYPAGGGGPSYPSGPPAYPSAPPPSTEPSSAPPFGWYPDPSGHHEKRYWDGTRWTENVSDGDERSIEPLPD